MTEAEQDYVLGTGDAEIARLGLQHRVWRPTMLASWQRAGLVEGCRVLDVGAGPGYATVDLAEIVGDHGEVVAVERSGRFLTAARQRCERSQVSNVRFHQQDVIDHPIPVNGFDIAWMRWLACFVSSPTTLVNRLAEAVRPGGIVVIHEYGDYGAWRLAPRSEPVEQFTQAVMQSWRDDGGEPDIGLELPTLLHTSGFDIIETRPHFFWIRPDDYMWRWPAAFLDVNLDRLVSLGRVTEDWAASVRTAFREAEQAPATAMMTPIVLEIIAKRRGVVGG